MAPEFAIHHYGFMRRNSELFLFSHDISVDLLVLVALSGECRGYSMDMQVSKCRRVKKRRQSRKESLVPWI